MPRLVTGFNWFCSNRGLFIEEATYVKSSVYISYREKEHGANEQNGKGINKRCNHFYRNFSSRDAFIKREDDVSTIKDGEREEVKNG